MASLPVSWLASCLSCALEDDAQHCSCNDQHRPIDRAHKYLKAIVEVVAIVQCKHNQQPDGQGKTCHEEPSDRPLQPASPGEDWGGKYERHAHHEVAEGFKRDEDAVLIVL